MNHCAVLGTRDPTRLRDYQQTYANTAPTVTRHIQEIEMIRGKVYSLEQQHNQMKAKYVISRPMCIRRVRSVLKRTCLSRGAFMQSNFKPPSSN